MELLQLKYFLELAKTEHLTKVAEMMYVSPPAVSNSISRLEEELGVQLFDRNGRRLKLNAYGNDFLQHARTALVALEDGKRKLADKKAAGNRRLKIAASNPEIWRNAIEDFQYKNPNVQIEIKKSDFSLQKNNLTEEADLVFASTKEFVNLQWNCKELFNDCIALVVSRDHHLAKESAINLEQARDEEFISLLPCEFETFCKTLCENAGFTPKCRILCENDLRPQIAISQNKVFLSPVQYKEFSGFSDMVFIPILDENATWSQAVFWEKERYLSENAVLMRNYMIERYLNYQIY